MAEVIIVIVGTTPHNTVIETKYSWVKPFFNSAIPIMITPQLFNIHIKQAFHAGSSQCLDRQIDPCAM